MSAGTRADQASHAGKHRPCVIGLTGPIASGKSTVAGMLHELGAVVIDADQVYRHLLTTKLELTEMIVAKFGPGILTNEGEIDRATLGEVVFRDPSALADLERITHPVVVAEIRRLIGASDAEVVVVEAVKLIESGLASDADSVWLVTADPELLLRRLIVSRGLNEAEARARLDASLDVADPKATPDILIQNSGDMSRLASAVNLAWHSVASRRLPCFRSANRPAVAKEHV